MIQYNKAERRSSTGLHFEMPTVYLTHCEVYHDDILQPSVLFLK